MRQENWNSKNLKNQIDDLLNLRDELVQKLLSYNGHDSAEQCGCGHDHSH